MRIGVYFDDVPSDVGGGYTFQFELLKSLVNLAGNYPRHDFFFISSNKKLNSLICAKNIAKNIHFLEIRELTVFDRLYEWMRVGLPFFPRIIRVKGPIQRLLDRNNIEFIWFLGGGCYETVDTPYIATVWDLMHRTHPWLPEVSASGVWSIREMLHRVFLARATYIITGTEVGKKELQFFYQIPEDRIIKLPHPVPSLIDENAQVISCDVRNKYGIKRPFILYPAQFWAHKNHINLLLALQILLNEYSLDIDLIFVGSDKGNMDFVKRSANNLHLEDHVYFLGFVPKEDLFCLYNEASMLTYVSLCGPENLPPLEAFSVGCPVLASDILGSSEQLGDACLYCTPYSQRDIAEKIYKLYSDTALREVLIENGYRRAKQFTTKDFIDGVMQAAEIFSTVRRNWK